MRAALALMLVVACTASSTPTAEPTSVVESAESSLVCWTHAADASTKGITFRDATAELGLVDPLTGIHGHAAAWGDVNSDGYADLLVGTFADRPVERYQVRGAQGPKPDRLLVSNPRLSAVDGWSSELERTSGALFADLDGDGDDDLVLIRNAGGSKQLSGVSRVFESRGGDLLPVAEILSPGFKGRTPTVADYDGDGLLDLYVSEDRYGKTGGVLLMNSGGFVFSNQTVGSGLEGAFSLGAATADLNDDGHPDLALSTAIYINNGDATFREETPDGYVTEPFGDEDDPAGVALGDLNNDGLPDVVVGQHFRSTVESGTAAPIRVFLNESTEDQIAFIDITDSTGIPLIETLAPHVQIADFNNDTFPDILTSASADAGSGIAVFVNQGGGTLSFRAAGEIGSEQYWVGAPVADIDQDGRLDVLAVEWEPSLPSIVFLNESEAGHWLEVSVDGPGRGIGSVVTVTSEAGALLGRQEIGIATGYSSASQPVAHFGLGAHTMVWVTIKTTAGVVQELGLVGADAHLRFPKGC